MSGFVSASDSDQIPYVCKGCTAYWSMPGKALRSQEIDGVPIDAWRVKDGVPTRCLPCATILGVIEKLNDLVFREPYLLTEGMAGKPKKEAWELVGTAEEEKMDSGHGESGRSSAGDGRTIEESMIFRKKVMKNFMATAGEGWLADEEEEKQEEKKLEEKKDEEK